MSTKHTPLVIRADANTAIGTGHLMRCLALGQAWKDAGGRVVFLSDQLNPLLKDRLVVEGMEVSDLSVPAGSIEDARQTAGLSRKLGATWVVVDGYHFGAEYQRIIKDHSLNLLFIDDYGHAEHYAADFVLNQNLHAEAGLYVNREPYTRLLLGPRYVLLRREFQKWAGWSRDTPETARKILVSLGGSDPNNVTSKVIAALQLLRINGLEAKVVIGGSNPHKEQLLPVAKESATPITVKSNVANMSKLMAWADIAVTAGGSTCWELAFMGVPSLILMVADNQVQMAERLHQLGAAQNLGHHATVSMHTIVAILNGLLLDYHKRLWMTRNGNSLVDGRGVYHVRNTLRCKIVSNP